MSGSDRDNSVAETSSPSASLTTSGPRQGKPDDLLPSIAAPKGGGAIRGIGEKFTTDAATGTGSLTIPLAVSPGRGGFTPDLALRYDSGAGNGPFGLGFHLSVPSITRKTDKGLPRYFDDPDVPADSAYADAADVFVLSGAEDLVPARTSDAIAAPLDTFDSGAYRVQRYRPRVEGLFARIERWTLRATGDAHWRATTRDNVLSIYGRSAEARIADPAQPSHVFSWLLEETRDDRGNVCRYRYKAEDGAGVSIMRASEGSRFDATGAFTATAQRYLKRVLYGNRTPLAATDPAPDDETAWLFEVVFDYGEHDAAAPRPAETTPWPVRVDPFSTYRATFEVRTYRQCQRVLMFHRFAELSVLGDAACLVKSTDFTYAESHVTSATDASYDGGAVATRLASATHAGYLRDATTGAYTRATLPPLTLGFSEAVIHDAARVVERSQLDGIPGASGPGTAQWLDLDGEGIPGLLATTDRAWFYQANLGDGQLAAPALQRTLPAPAELGDGATQLVDLDGSGQLDIVRFAPPLAGYFERTADPGDRDQPGWRSFVPLRELPDLDWSDPNLRFVDLDGDGLPDLLITEHETFRWYRSRGADGFSPAHRVTKPKDDTLGPAIVFADGTETIHLADMSGDGLVDLVRVRNGEVCYWPNLGYGRFGKKVTLDGVGRFDTPEQFDPRRIRLGDLDGSGTSDVVYLARDGARLHFNVAGNALSPPLAIASLPRVDSFASLAVLDLLGHGTACLVWSTAAPARADRPLAYVDLLADGKPHLLTSITNNLGGETRLTYAPSTQFYLADKAAGRPWLTRLPFPVHVLARVDHLDHVTGSSLVSRYAYHHGFFDGYEREFRGFARVEQWDAETFDAGDPTHETDHEIVVPPVHTKTWFHTGAWLERERLEHLLADEYYAGDPSAPQLAEPAIPSVAAGQPRLTVREEREATRALRGQMLRQEVYADDGTAQAAHPYTVSETRVANRVLQRVAGAAHGVFHVIPDQVVALHYERNPADPRLVHDVTLDVDPYGNVTRSCALAYPRRAPAQPEQSRLWATLTERTVVNEPAQPDWYRLGVVVEEIASELTGLTAPAAGTTATISPDALRAAIAAATEIPFETDANGTSLQRRTIARTRSLFYKNDLTAALPLGTIESLALPYQSYRLAFTPGLLTQVYDTRIDDTTLSEGGYVSQDSLWWAPSSRAVFDPTRFYLPTESIDPFGNHAFVTYDTYSLLAVDLTDPLGNHVTAGARDVTETVTSNGNDYRVLAPVLVTDPNQNRTATTFDALGMPIAIAVMGKPGSSDGDTLADPTTRVEYDLLRWQTSAGTQPAFVHTFAREQHGAANPRWQEAFTYTDGFGRVVQKKVQAAPGPVPAAGSSPAVPNADPRWIGTGRTVFDNKGNPVKKYEPFFSTTSDYEAEAAVVEWGVTPILHYDPLGRLVRTDFPDGTLARVELDAWQQATWDPNDTVNESTWLARMQAGTTAEQRAATLTLAHANTPTTAHLDSLGRVFLTIALADTTPTGPRLTRVALDIQGNARTTTDPRGIVVATQTFDALGRVLHAILPDAGESRVLADVANRPIRDWTARGYRHRRVYDALRRPTHLYVQLATSDSATPPAPEWLAERTAYGDSLPTADALAANARTRAVRVFDGAGALSDAGYDFKGNLLSSTRRLATTYQTDVDWSALASLTNIAALDAAAAPQLGDASDTFTTSLTYDALNRITSKTTPDASVTIPTYDPTNLLSRIDVRLRGAATTTPFVTRIDYNARGQRQQIAYGNATTTVYTYDPLTFRLTDLRTTRDSGGFVLQDLAYTYDAVGNIVELDDAVSYGNPNVPADGLYEYDALYQLTSATGREHPGQQPTNVDSDLLRLDHPEDLQTLRRYSETYTYDPSGNITTMAHVPQGGASGWTRRYNYATDSNRLVATSLPGDALGTFSAPYTYDAHGNMASMPHLAQMGWDHAERFASADLGGGGDVYFTYDATGQRVRKAYAHGGTLDERIYLGGFELYRQRNLATGAVSLARETLHIMDDQSRVALVETKTVDTSSPNLTPTTRTRFQLANHLSSSLLELDETAAVITYEEYFSYGGTSFHAADSATDVSAKRYRYCGLERDDETSLDYVGARYYSSWLGRWTSADPTEISDGTNLYRYAHDNPNSFVDPSGLDAQAVVLHFLGAVGVSGKPYKQPDAPATDEDDTDDTLSTLVPIVGDTKRAIQGAHAVADYAREHPEDVERLFEKLVTAAQYPVGEKILESAEYDAWGLFLAVRHPRRTLIGVAHWLDDYHKHPLQTLWRTLTSCEPNCTNIFVAPLLAEGAGRLVPVARAALTFDRDLVTVYRGINESHFDFLRQSSGLVMPNKPWWQFWRRPATPFEHNAVRGGTLRSPYTSWTMDKSVAENFALRPDGTGVVLEAKVPRRRLVTSPDTKRVHLIHKAKTVPESEVLIRGKVTVPPSQIRRIP